MALVNVFLSMGIIGMSTTFICMLQYMSSGKLSFKTAFTDVQDTFWISVGFIALAIVGLLFV